MRLKYSEAEVHRLSRDTRLIAWLALSVGAIFVVFTFFFPRTFASRPSNDLATGLYTDVLEYESAAGVLKLVREALITLRSKGDSWDRKAMEDMILNRFHFDPVYRELFLDFTDAAKRDTEEAEMGYQRLLEHAAKEPPMLFANELLADVYRWRGDTAKAQEHYRAEIELYPGATHSRDQIFLHLMEINDREALKAFMSNPDLRMDNHAHWLRLGVMLRDPGFILRGIIMHDYADLPPVVWVLSLPVALLWFWILKKICFVPSWKSKPVLFGFLGMILGVISTTVTLFAVVWQEHIWGLELNGEALNDLMVYVLGVGVREETIKLLLFLPLVPWLYRSRDPRAVLIAAACVGLGFAVQENIGYFQRYGGTLSRFVTANFFHIILTGTLGLAFCRFLYTPRREWDRFLATYIVVILVHGIYDFLASQSEGAFFAIMLFCSSAYYFFDLVEKHCQPTRQVISPLSVFVVGCSIIFGCSLLANAATSYSFHQTLSRSGQEILGIVPLMFLYINRFRHV